METPEAPCRATRGCEKPSPGGSSRWSSGLVRLRSPDALVLLFSAAAVILLLPLRDLSVAFLPVAFAATLVLFMAPGFLLSHWLLGDDMAGPTLVPVGFAISTGIFGLLGVPALILHLSTEDYLLAAGTLLAAFLAAAVWRTLRPKEHFSPEREAPLRSSGGLVVGTFRVSLRGSGLCGGQEGAQQLRRYLGLPVVGEGLRDSERLALLDPYFGERIAEFSRAKVNGWLLEQAALSRVSGLDTIELVLRYLTPTLVVVALLMVYALALAIVEERAGRGPHRLCLRPVPHHLYPAFRAQRRGGAGSPHLGGQVRSKVPDSARYATLRPALRGAQEVEASRPLHVLLLVCDSCSSFCATGHRAVHARLRGGARGCQSAPEGGMDRDGSARAGDVERRPRATRTLTV